jgi:hypothetical protein
MRRRVFVLALTGLAVLGLGMGLYHWAAQPSRVTQSNFELIQERDTRQHPRQTFSKICDKCNVSRRVL